MCIIPKMISILTIKEQYKNEEDIQMENIFKHEFIL